jgi:tRNA-splicing ligase RtcB
MIKMKKTKIYAEIIEDTALEQFNNAMKLECNIQGALMPDAHTGYTLPIGAVIKSKEMIFPAYVGYDIGCGMCAIKLDITKDDINLINLKNRITKNIPLGQDRYKKPREYQHLPLTDEAKKIYEKVGKYQLGTLGGGNHFIELGTGDDEKVWIVIHSGSRGFGKQVAEYYMKLATFINIDTKSLEDQFEQKNQRFKENNPSRFEESKIKYVMKQGEALIKKNLEAHNGFKLNSIEGQNYIKDMESCLQFALDNRKAMIDTIVHFLGDPKELLFINRNHNHAEILEDNCIIHRKGATHASKDMYGVIPGNMKDGSFIVKGKGNSDSMCSSSHGAGRVLSRSQAFKTLSLEEFNNSMEDIVTNHCKATLDEAPKAYKNIFEVMELQKDLVDVVDYVKPILNIKG